MINNLTEWGLSLQCYYIQSDSDVQCCSILPFTLYTLFLFVSTEPPDKVSISFVNHTGPLIEDHAYTLQCTVHDVAPVKKVVAIFYRGDLVVGREQLTEVNEEKTMTQSFLFKIVPSKDKDGAEYWCAAELVLGPEGPQPPPVVKSQKMTTTVYCESVSVNKDKPELQSKPPGLITISKGEQLKLNCSSDGNPRPSYNWTLPSGSPHPSRSSVLTIASVAPEDEGKYTCTVSNDYGNVTTEFDVELEPSYIIYIIVGIVLAVLLLIIGVCIWSRYYRQTRMGRYNLKDVFRFRSAHSAVPTAE
ncbi:vascular cell adhesion protein 1-like [Tautogolabrus adspersus]